MINDGYLKLITRLLDNFEIEKRYLISLNQKYLLSDTFYTVLSLDYHKEIL